MENLEKTFEKDETVMDELHDEEGAKKIIMALLEDIKHKAEENLLTDDYCTNVLWAVYHIIELNGLSREGCKVQIEGIVKLLDQLPQLRKASLVNGIVEQLNYPDEINTGMIVGSLAVLQMDGMTRKQIKKAVNKQLTVEQRKAFTKLLDELGAAPGFLAMAGDANKKVAELFDGVESKPVSRDDAHEMIVDYMSHWTTHLVKTKSVVHTVTFQKGDQEMCTNQFFTNYAEKAVNLEILRSHVQVIKPDAIITVSAVWVSCDFATGKRWGDNCMPSNDPNRREGLMVVVETPTDYWLAVQMFSRGSDGEIVLEELVGPDLVETPEGNFVFMEKSSAVIVH